MFKTFFLLTHLSTHSLFFRRQGGIETRRNMAEGDARRLRVPPSVFPAKLREKYSVANERFMLSGNGEAHVQRGRNRAARIIQVIAALSYAVSHSPCTSTDLYKTITTCIHSQSDTLSDTHDECIGHLKRSSAIHHEIPWTEKL